MRIVFVLLATVLLFPSICLAQDLGEEYIGLDTYFEVKAGQFKPTGDFVIVPPPNGFSGELSLGHRFSKYFALEVGYGYNKSQGDIIDYLILHPIYGVGILTNGFGKVEAYSLLATAKLMYPVEDGFVYAGGGYGRYQVHFSWEYDFYYSGGRIPETYEDKDTVNGWHYVLGTMLDWNEWTIGFEYKNQKTETAEFEDKLLGIPVFFETDMDARILSGFIQLRF